MEDLIDIAIQRYVENMNKEQMIDYITNDLANYYAGADDVAIEDFLESMGVEKG